MPEPEALLSEVFPPDALAGTRLAGLWPNVSLPYSGRSWTCSDGDPEAALGIVAHLYEQVRRTGSEQPIAELLLVQGEALLRLRRWDAAQEALEGARRGAVQRMNPSSLWRAHALLARLYHATTQVELARREWEAVHAVLEPLATTIEDADVRAAFHKAALADMPRSARRTPHSPRTAPRAQSLLTSRELEVARLIAQGRSNHEIAQTLVLSERTVTTHVSHILGKLGYTSRTQIVAWLVMGAGLSE